MKPIPSALPTLASALMTGLSLFVAADVWCDTLPAATVKEAPSATAASPGPGPVTAPTEPHGSGVVLQYLVPPAIRVGQSVTVTLYFSNVTADDGARVVVRTIDPGKQLAAFYVQKGEDRTLDLPMLLTTDGTQYLAVATTQAGRTSVQVVPLRVGSGKVTLRKEGTPRTTPAGEKLLSLPASR